MMELEVGQQLFDNIPDTSSLLSLFNPLVIEVHEKSETIFRVGDLWVPIFHDIIKVGFSFLELNNCLM